MSESHLPPEFGVKSDRRRYPRYRVPAQLFLESDKSAALEVKDLSVGGLSFTSPLGLSGKELSILLNLRPATSIPTLVKIIDSKRFFTDVFLNRSVLSALSLSDLKRILGSFDERFLVSDRRLKRRTSAHLPDHSSAEIDDSLSRYLRNPRSALKKSVAKFEKIFSRAASSPDDFTFHATVAAIHEVCAYIAACERSGIAREEILAITEPARRIHSLSPFLNRLQTWPRGYPGDFETIGVLLNKRRSIAAKGATAALEEYALNTAMAQQHRNKVRRQGEVISRAIRTANSEGRTAKILIIACGGSPDLESIQADICGKDFKIVLNDVEPDAIRLSLERLSLIREYCVPVVGDVFNSLSRLKNEGPYDLVVAGGLFDYLTDRQAKFLLHRCFKNLVGESADFFFTNIASNNPYRLWMDYLVDWVLFERSESDVIALGASLGVPRELISVSRDSTGLSLFACLKKPSMLRASNQLEIAEKLKAVI